MIKGESANDGVLDFETDPFLAGRVPLPFAVGIYFGQNDYAQLWKSDSRSDFLSRCANALDRMPKCTLYAHNGGRFDFHYLLEYANPGSIEIRNGRVTKMEIARVTLRDSFPLMPFPLEEFRKTPIDYSIFEKRRRDSRANRNRIESYLLDDCRDLHELLHGFRAIVGPKHTIGSAAFYQMRKLGIDIEAQDETHDALFRSYYFGGRVQAFESGVLDGPFHYYDINSAYPRAMLENHPHGGEYRRSTRLPSLRRLGPQFIHCVGTSKGALPLRGINGELSFPIGTHEFFATGWEIKAGLETHTLVIEKVLNVWTPARFINFSVYVNTFFALRKRAKDAKDKIGALAYKYLLNSGYGKFAQNPRDFRVYRLEEYGYDVPGYAWESDFGGISLWSKPNYQGRGFFDVATGASITGYVRANIWRAVCAATRPVYIDTDAMICKRAKIPLGSNLGEWKEEGEGAHVEQMAIAGKKLYGVKWSRPVDGERYKIASKGARLTWRQLLQLCSGKSIVWKNAAPTFSLTGAHFVKREINATI